MDEPTPKPEESQDVLSVEWEADFVGTAPVVRSNGRPVAFVCDTIAAHMMAAAPEMLRAIDYVLNWNARSWDAERARDLCLEAQKKARRPEPMVPSNAANQLLRLANHVENDKQLLSRESFTRRLRYIAATLDESGAAARMCMDTGPTVEKLSVQEVESLLESSKLLVERLMAARDSGATKK